MTFQKAIISLQNAISMAIKHNIDLNKKIDDDLYDYKEKQKLYHLNTLISNLKLVKSDSLSLPQLTKHDIRKKMV